MSHKPTAKLTDLAIRNAKAGRLDGPEGLWVEVSSTGKAFRTRYTMAGKTRQITLGYYPDMSLVEAKAARLEVRRKVLAGVDPQAAPPRSERLEARTTGTVEAKARTWHAYMAATTWSEAYATQVLQRLEAHAFRAIGAMPVEQVARRHVIDLVQACVTKAGKHQADHVRKHLLTFFDELVLREEITHNPAAGLAKKFQPPKRRHQPAVLEVEAARAVLAKMEASTATPMMKLLHRFAALTGVRPSEARLAEWREVADGVWEIPAERMKGRRGRQEPHTCFLSQQALDVLAVAKLHARGERYVFPTDYRTGREEPLGRDSISERMRRELTGYRRRDGVKREKPAHVPHGWRATMATILTKLHRPDADLIQAMLAHQTKGAVAGRYDRTTLHMHEARVRELADEWATLLLAGAPPASTLAGLPVSAPIGGNVVPMRRAA